MTQPPISYPDALAAVKLINFHLGKSAPHTFGMTGPKFADMCADLGKVEQLLAAIVEIKARKGRAPS